MEPHTLNQLTALETGSVAFVYEEGKQGISIGAKNVINQLDNITKIFKV